MNELMEYRSSPVLGQYSPNELLMSRLTRTKIAVSPDILKPKVVLNTELLLRQRERSERMSSNFTKNRSEVAMGKMLKRFHRE